MKNSGLSFTVPLFTPELASSLVPKHFVLDEILLHGDRSKGGTLREKHTAQGDLRQAATLP